MTRPITTPPADTARAMHGSEMRGQDMQDAPSQHDQLATMISDLSHTGELSMLYRMEIADAITELRARCQRRIDAAVAELVKALHEIEDYSLAFADMETVSDMAGEAIRARGQK